MNNIQMVDLKRQYIKIKHEIDIAINQVIESTNFITGPEVGKFSDELAQYLVPAKPGHEGNNYNLRMTCSVNGIQVSEGNMGDMDWTFAEIVERCAYGADIFPGDVIGSGTVGTGCFLELNGTGKLNDPNYPVQWLQAGDVVEMTIDGLGCLTNTIKKEDSDFSILNLKKKGKTA